jgi:hypothetical protein
MKNVIGLILSAVCFSLLLQACEREDILLSLDERSQVPALALTSSVTDPEGDAVASQGNGLTGEAYQDIVGAEVTAEGHVFTFTMDVAAAIPAAPVLSHGITLLEWSWNLNTSPEFPKGFPFATGNVAPPEFMVMVLWNGPTFTGILIDRRPLLTGGDVVITSVPFSIEGATVSASVNASLLGHPSSFAWIARANNWPKLGTSSLQTLDRAPDAAPAFWP